VAIVSAPDAAAMATLVRITMGSLPPSVVEVALVFAAVLTTATRPEEKHAPQDQHHPLCGSGGRRLDPN
jgi:hypothetical protein